MFKIQKRVQEFFNKGHNSFLGRKEIYSSGADSCPKYIISNFNSGIFRGGICPPDLIHQGHMPPITHGWIHLIRFVVVGVNFLFNWDNKLMKIGEDKRLKVMVYRQLDITQRDPIRGGFRRFYL